MENYCLQNNNNNKNKIDICGNKWAEIMTHVKNWKSNDNYFLIFWENLNKKITGFINPQCVDLTIAPC